MSPAQIDLARHALGLPNRARKSYRNHFVAGPGCSDFNNWEAMVAAGYAVKRKGGSLSGGDPIFFLTRSGADLALEAGERLDPEDFPKAA